MSAFDDFRAICEKRHSTRYFDEKPVDMNVIEKLLDAARFAPSIENTQPWHFHVLQDAVLREKMMKAACYGAFLPNTGTLIVVTCNKAARPATQQIIWNPNELEYSCVAALDHLMLAATAMGLGSCWVSLHHGPSHNILRLPDHHVVVGGMMVGYAKVNDKTEKQHDRKKLEECYTVH